MILSHRRCREILRSQIVGSVVGARKFAVMAVVALLAFAASGAAAQYEPWRVIALEVSPDGRWAAVATDRRELLVVDLVNLNSIRRVTDYPGGGFGWSPDSRWLAFCERLPGRSPSLWLFEPGAVGPAGKGRQGRSPKPIVSGTDWIGQPGWIDDGHIALLSSRGSDHVNVWLADADSGDSKKIIDCGRDITGLWTSPVQGELIYRSAQTGGTELWWLWGVGEEPVRLTRDNARGGAGANQVYIESMVRFSADGQYVGFVSEGARGRSIIAMDLGRGLPVGELEVEQRPRSLEPTSGGEVVITLGDEVYRWMPGAKSAKRALSKPMRWNDLPLGFATEVGRDGWVAVANGNLIVTADKLKGLDRGRMLARNPRDLIAMAVAWDNADAHRQAAGSLKKLAKGTHGRTGAVIEFEALRTRAWIERRRARAGRAARLLRDARLLGSGTGGGEIDTDDLEAVIHEHMFIHLFERGDAQDAGDLIAALPESYSAHRRVVWARSLLASEDSKLRKRWRKAGLALRRGDWAQSASELRDLVGADRTSEVNRLGMALVVTGDFDPLAPAILNRDADVSGLIDDYRFQEAIIEISRSGDLTEEVTAGALRALLLGQWARSGQFDVAQRLLGADLRDPNGPFLEYADMLERYLLSEEQDLWLETAVVRVFFAKDVIRLLERHMSETRPRMVLLLARAKAALIAGEMEKLDALLTEAERNLNLIPSSFWTADTAELLLLVHLYRAKHHERQRRWRAALDSYALCQSVLGRFARDWDVTAFDVALFRSAVEAARGEDSDRVQSWLGLQRGLGDPLVNPANDRATLMSAMTNIDTLRRFDDLGAMKPYLAYTQGVVLAGLGRVFLAIDALQAARAPGAPPALRSRALLEEAALRFGLGQSDLAVRLLDKIDAAQLDAPRLATLIRTRAQAERACGLIDSEIERMGQLAASYDLGRGWLPIPTSGPDNFAEEKP